MRRFEIVAMTLVVIGVSSSPAHAYLDPGTGSILLQSLIAGAAGALLFCKSYWWRLKSYFQRSNKMRGEDREGDGEQ